MFRTISAPQPEKAGIFLSSPAYFFVSRRFIRGRGIKLAAAAFLFTGHVSASAKDNPSSDAAALLRSIVSPIDLLRPYLPPSYSVPVTVLGPAADEMKRMYEKLNLPPPRYKEVFDDGRRFSLYLANTDYPLETRECMTGIFNPVEMIDLVVASALKYREEGMFSIVVKETAGSVSRETRDGKPAFRVCLRPTGAYFGYTYQDVGAYVREGWLTYANIVLDSALRLPRELVLRKCTRQFQVSDTRKPPVDSCTAEYSFSYGDCEGVLVPVGLRLRVNGVLTLTLSASYRPLGKTYRVFDTREICCPQSGADSCLVMRYDDYRVGEVPRPVKNPIKPATYQKNLERAAQLSQEASAALHRGDIDASIRACRKLVSQYPETPQALEANRLLSGLPGGK